MHEVKYIGIQGSQSYGNAGLAMILLEVCGCWDKDPKLISSLFSTTNMNL